jgi:hypothetical protein
LVLLVSIRLIAALLAALLAALFAARDGRSLRLLLIERAAFSGAD